jgi:hypothetical protein
MSGRDITKTGPRKQVRLAGANGKCQVCRWGLLPSRKLLAIPHSPQNWAVVGWPSTAASMEGGWLLAAPQLGDAP